MNPAVRIRVPATSANLGPGFDSFGLALGWHDEVVARPLPDPGVRITVEGESAGDVPLDERHLVARAMLATFDRLGWRPAGLALTCRNQIPHGRGLGSSAAAIVAGVLAARTLAPGGPERLDDRAALALAAGLEGHPDNVAACLLGGLTIAWTGAEGFEAVRVEPGPVELVAFVPDRPVATELARGLLPAEVPHADAAINAGRAGLLVAVLSAGLTSGSADAGLLLAATEDRLHQRFRAPAMPGSVALVAELRERGVPAVVSGAGPTVLAFTQVDTGKALVDAVADTIPDGFRAHVLPVDRVGAGTTPGPPE